MHFSLNMPIMRAFALSAGMALGSAAFAQEQDHDAAPITTETPAAPEMPVLPEGLPNIPGLQEMLEAQGLAPEAPEAGAPSRTPTDAMCGPHNSVDSALEAAGLSEVEVKNGIDIILQNFFRISRHYVEAGHEMEDLEALAVEGIKDRVCNRDEKLTEAQTEFDAANEEFESIKTERDAVVDSGAEVSADLRDRLLEAEIALSNARNALRVAQAEQKYNAPDLIMAGLNHAMADLDPHSDFAMGGGTRPAASEDDPPRGAIGIVAEADGESAYTLERGIRVKTAFDPQDNTPAYKAGIRAGDLITHIDGEALAGMLLSEATDLIAGEPSTSMAVTFVRGDRTSTVHVQRQEVHLANVTHRVVGNYGYIHINSYMNEQDMRADAGVDEGMKKAVEDIRKKLGGDDNVAGYVISVRGNGGGSVQEVILQLDQLIEGEDFDRSYGAQVPEEVKRRNTLLTTRDRDGLDERFLASPGDITNGKPIAVLIDGGSASASEIFSGTMQAWGRAIIVGINSFNKGTVQIISPDSTGAGQLHYTISQYLYGKGTEESPFGLAIQGYGVTPEVLVPFIPAAEKSENDLPNVLQFEDGEDPRRVTESTLVCERDEVDPPLTGPMAENGFIDPRSGEFDHALACAIMALQQQNPEVTSRPSADKGGVLIRDYVPPVLEMDGP